jgi:hypothetical protein
MDCISLQELARRFRGQHGVVSRSQSHALRVSRNMIQRRLTTGEWEGVTRKTVRLLGAGPPPEQDLLAICLTAGLTAVAYPVLRGKRDMPVHSEALQARAALQAAAAVRGDPLTRSRLR